MKKNAVITITLLLLAVAAVLLAVVMYNPPTETTGAVVPTTDAVVPKGKVVRKIVNDFESLDVKMPEPAPIPPKEVKMAFTGDLMLHEWQANDAYNKNTGEYDFNYCFDGVRRYLAGPDFTVGNLETTFAGKESGYGYYPTFNAPDSFGDALRNAGFDFLTTANNHSNDRRALGITRTIDRLDFLGIGHTGTFKSQEERDTIAIQEVNSIKFAFLSYTYGTNGIPLEETYHANLLDDDLIKADIQRAKALEPDFIIIMPHMGNEYEEYTRDEFKDRIRGMIDAGADVVMASHPHVLQPAEFISVPTEDGGTRTAFAAYSLGNFISSQRTIPRDEGIIFNLVFEKPEGEKAYIKSVSYIPTWVKFVDAAGNYDIRVLSVYDVLSAYLRGEETGVRDKDITRLKNVHSSISKKFLNYEVPLEEIQNEYFLPLGG